MITIILFELDWFARTAGVPATLLIIGVSLDAIRQLTSHNNRVDDPTD